MHSSSLLLCCCMLIAFIALPAAIHAHQFRQPQSGEDLSDFHPIALDQQGSPTTYYSYHIHGYFLASNTNQTAAATALRQSFIDEFSVQPCGGSCDTECPSICHWDLNMVPMGPHPVGSFGFYVPLEQFIDALGFISMNHGDLSILVHPNSGYPIIDHSLNSFWIKQILPLDLSQLVPYEPPTATTATL